jgi:hypothetical protein
MIVWVELSGVYGLRATGTAQAGEELSADPSDLFQEFAFSRFDDTHDDLGALGQVKEAVIVVGIDHERRELTWKKRNRRLTVVESS